MYDKIYYPYPSTDNKHKFFIITNQGKKVNFGSSKNRDYTIYYKEYGKDIANIKRNAYIARHSKLKEIGVIPIPQDTSVAGYYGINPH